MKIKILESQQESLWDEYVRGHDGGTFFHQIAWKNLIHTVYHQRFKPFYLTAVDRGRIRGILPVWLCSTGTGGKKMISIPFAGVGGPCADSEPVKTALVGHAVEIMRMQNASVMELRNLSPLPGDFYTQTGYTTQILLLDKNPEKVWKSFRADIRQRINSAEKNKIRVAVGQEGFETFYRIYGLGQRNLGTPIQRREWLKHLYFDFPDNHMIGVAYYHGKPVSVQFIRKFKETMTSVFSYNIPKYKNLYPNHMILWECIRAACADGMRYFDFGRSYIGSGVFGFKRGWGAEPQQYYYQFYRTGEQRITDTGQANPAREKFANIWKRLPVCMANRLGPVIRDRFP